VLQVLQHRRIRQTPGTFAIAPFGRLLRPAVAYGDGYSNPSIPGERACAYYVQALRATPVQRGTCYELLAVATECVNDHPSFLIVIIIIIITGDACLIIWRGLNVINQKINFPFSSRFH
jgi:hypothetical protein